MAGSVPLNPQMMSQLQQQLAQTSVQNPRTPNSRKSPKEEFLERLNSIKALLKHIEEQDLAGDPIYAMILDRFKGAVLQMQLSADANYVLQTLGAAFGAQGAPMGQTPPGVPGAGPTPAPASVSQMPGGPQPPQAPGGNSPLNPTAVS